ncbi:MULTISPECIES: MFS transporter [Bacillaceae]|uniref:MFS transporter n=1 Tax=Bacillaceae TaxID=186817 RepID=UPI000BFBEBD0|nr:MULTISPECIES: MFS transporter [Bacillaceae]PGT90570.1 MFS transporter [Bacillus sp. AFS040349]UGB30890.1 MFS transporter [Metabacillus sp. B2-18]
MNHQEKQPIWTQGFISIFLSNFFIFVAFYGLLTSLPIYVVDELGRSSVDAGLIITIFMLSAIIVRPFSGKLIQDFGKKKTLMISMILFTVFSFMYLWVENYALLLVLRFVHGIWFSIASTATGAIAADIVPLKRRGEGLGYFAMSMNLAVVCGPFISLTLLQYVSFSILFLVLASLITIGVLFTAFSKMTEVKKSSPVEKKRLQFSDLIDQKALPIALVGSLVAFTYSSVLSFISMYAKDLDLIEAASYFFLVFAVAMIIARPFSGRLYDTKGPNVVIYPALVLFMIGLLLLSIAHNAFMLLFAGAFVGLGYGTVVPCFQTLAVQATDHHRSSHATATFFTLFDTGIATGSFVLGIVVAQLGYETLYLLTGLFLILVIFMYKLVQSRKKAISTALEWKESSL